jgi:hypothetical protein
MMMIVKHWHPFEREATQPPYGHGEEVDISAEEVLRLVEDFQVMLRKQQDGQIYLWLNKQGRTWGQRG